MNKKCYPPPPLSQHLSYENGEHGKLYTVSITAEYKNGILGETYENQALFLNYDELPNLPIIVINTVNEEDPTYEVAERPEEVFGNTIVNNEYVSGEMLMYENGIKGGKSISDGVKIRVRGNTSSLMGSKKSYKIHLNNPYPLLADDDISCKEWLLLNNGVNLNTYIGDYVGDICGMEWQPHMRYVNVILNGDWKGCYCLTAAVGIDSAGSNVSNSGYIFENDAYWWNSNGLYFKTQYQQKQLGYTFKYPEITNPEDEVVLRLQQYMQEFENCILSGSKQYRMYIDETSYARWILAQDILGNSDGAGSNMYFYKYDYDENNPTSSKVKMGPLWDFDAAFNTEGAYSFSRVYFTQLLEQDTFYNEYLNIWLTVEPNLNNEIEQMLNQLEIESGNAIDESWRLDATRWMREVESFEAQKERVIHWFQNRVVWMNNELVIDAMDISSADVIPTPP